MHVKERFKERSDRKINIVWDKSYKNEQWNQLKYSDIKKKTVTRYISNHTQSRKLLKENDGSRIEAMHKQFDYFDHTNYEQK